MVQQQFTYSFFVMKWGRAILLVGVFLLAGAGLNMLVAWSLYANAFRNGVSTIPMGIHIAPIGSWPEPTTSWLAPHVGRVTDYRFETTTYFMRAIVTPEGLSRVTVSPDVQRAQIVTRIGWPFRCASQKQRFEIWTIPVPAGHTQQPNFDNGVDTILFPFPMPGYPIWPGFIANTLIYSLLLFTVYVVTVKLWRWLGPKRRRRIMLGCCPACGYDRRGIDASLMCPECGS